MSPFVSVNLAVVLLTAAAVAAAVGLHYEGLNWLARRLARGSPERRRRRVLHAVIGVLVLHVTEIWIFAFAYWAAWPCPAPAPWPARRRPACWTPSTCPP